MKKKTKFLLLRSSIIAAFAILSGRLWYVQVVSGGYYKQQADTSKIRVLPVQAPRGIIYDRTGKQQLVFNAPSWNIEIVPHGVPTSQQDRIYATLSRLLHRQRTPWQIWHTVQTHSWQPYTPAVIKANVSFQTAMIIKQLHGQLPGVRADPSSTRSYVHTTDPQFSLSHLMGYTTGISEADYLAHSKIYRSQHVDATDQEGQAGVEWSLDAYLHGVNGRSQVEVDAGERPVRVLKPAKTVPGDSVQLTIDAKLQQKVSADLAAALQHLGLRRGVAIVEDVNSGQILSMVSLPSFDNNLFSGFVPIKQYEALTKDPAQPLYDLATQGLYPPGSTYKVISAAAALGTGTVSATTTVNDTGEIDLGNGAIFHGWQPPPGLGTVNVVSALARSSDIYFYTVIGGDPTIGWYKPRVGAQRLAHYARLFGLAQPTGIEVRGEMGGQIPTPSWFNHLPYGPLRNPGESWHIGNDYNVAIGQGQNLVTPLQMVNVTSTIANGGTLYRPRLVKQIFGRVVPRRGVLKTPRVIQPFVPSVVRRNVIDPANLALIQQGMHMSVYPPGYWGTSYNVRDPRIDAAGKTGTAEAPGGAHAWWIGYAPYRHPKVAVVVMVPNANSEGAYTSAPIAHKVLEDYFNLPPSKPDWLSDVQMQLVGTASQ